MGTITQRRTMINRAVYSTHQEPKITLGDSPKWFRFVLPSPGPNQPQHSIRTTKASYLCCHHLPPTGAATGAVVAGDVGAVGAPPPPPLTGAGVGDGSSVVTIQGAAPLSSQRMPLSRIVPPQQFSEPPSLRVQPDPAQMPQLEGGRWI